MNLKQVKDKINKELLPLYGVGGGKTRKWLREEGFKYCPSCHEIKCMGDFFPDRFNEGGLRAYCKTCNTEKNVKWNRENYKSRKGEYKKKILNDFVKHLWSADSGTWDIEAIKSELDIYLSQQREKGEDK